MLKRTLSMRRFFQKNHLIETVLLSTHNICFSWEKGNLFSYFAPLPTLKAWLMDSSFWFIYIIYLKTVVYAPGIFFNFGKGS